MEGLTELFLNYEYSNYIIVGVLAVGYVVKRFFSAKLGKYSNFINIAISDLVTLYDKQYDKAQKEEKHTAVAEAVYKALPKYVKIFISQDKVDSKIKKAVDNLRDKEKLVEVTTTKVLDIIPQPVENNQLKDIVSQVKKDMSITPIINPNFEDYKKSSFGIKISKLF
jgi:DNA-directed RNA polymerase subunit F